MDAVYQLKHDADRVAAIQKATLATKEFGIEPTHGLLGSREWWSEIESGRLPVHRLRGMIGRVYMGNMNDWPGFELVTAEGQKSSWTREANSKEQAARYVVGRSIEIDYVAQRHRPDSWDGGGEAKIVLFTLPVAVAQLLLAPRRCDARIIDLAP